MAQHSSQEVWLLEAGGACPRVDGDHRRISLWVQVMTGLELDDVGAVHLLDADTWLQRRRFLDEFGGRPGP